MALTPATRALLFLAPLAVLALFGPLLAPHDPLEQDLMAALAPPSWQHPFGKDHVGRDIASRLLAGAPYSLGLAALCVSLAVGVGLAMGLAAASGGWLRRSLILRLADQMLAFPGLLLAMLLAGLLGGGVWPMLIGLKMALWPQYARMTEAVALENWRANHVEAARLAGFSQQHILRRHVLQPVLGLILPLAALGIGSAIMAISALGFLGLGLRPPLPEWGAMASDMLPHLHEAPVQIAAPCLCIFVSVLLASLAGRSLTPKTETAA